MEHGKYYDQAKGKNINEDCVPDVVSAPVGFDSLVKRLSEHYPDFVRGDQEYHILDKHQQTEL